MPDRFRNFWAWILVAGAVVFGVMYYDDIRDQEARSRCQAAYNSAFIETIQIRSRISGQRQDAVDSILLGVTELVTAPEAETEKEREKRAAEFVKLFQEYAGAVKATDAARAANPLPEIPSC